MYGIVGPLTGYAPAKVSGEQQLGILYGGYAAGVLLSTPIFGHLGDRYGCRKPMVIGVFLMLLAIGLFSIGNSFSVLFVARLLQGASAAASWTAGLAFVAEHYVEKRVQMMGLAMLGSTSGSVIGPMLGTWLYDLGGYYLPFVVVAALVLCDLCFRLFLLPKSNAADRAQTDLQALLFDKSVLVAAVAVALSASSWGLIEPLLPVHLEKTLHAPAKVMGPMFTCATIAYGVMAPVVSLASERFSIKNTICLGMLLMAVTLPFLSLGTSPILTGFMLCLTSMSYAFVLNPTSAELGNAVDRKNMSCYAAVYAVYNIAYSLGMMSADTFAATIATQIPFCYSLLCMSSILILFLPLVLKAVADPEEE